jgi:hypothetical protein
MICRIWHGFTGPADADAYEQLLREEIFVGIRTRAISGYLASSYCGVRAWARWSSSP